MVMRRRWASSTRAWTSRSTTDPHPMPLTSTWNRWLLQPWVKPLLWGLCTLPLLWLFYRGATDQLGANPPEAVIRGTGEWTLRWLWLTLAVTPLRELASLPALLRLRRTLG